MGFPSYADYLRSPLWQGIRRRFLAANGSCYLCRKAASQVHHTSYTQADLDGTRTTGLRALCPTCHHAIEFRNRDGQKLDLDQANQKLEAKAHWVNAGPISDDRPPASFARRKNRRKK